uniref:Uncharacterized protein n=1 Tax=Oryza glumipatula TaxID=40148 RepID=A0A0D9ZKK8_9ORYZ
MRRAQGARRGGRRLWTPALAEARPRRWRPALAEARLAAGEAAFPEVWPATAEAGSRARGSRRRRRAVQRNEEQRRTALVRWRLAAGRSRRRGSRWRQAGAASRWAGSGGSLAPVAALASASSARGHGASAAQAEAVAAWWSQRQRCCGGAYVEPACAVLAGSGRPRLDPSPPRRMGGDVRMWSWRDDGLCWREAGIGLDIRGGDFLVAGRVFSLLSVSPPSLAGPCSGRGER